MKAVVLVGGEGTRLRPLTLTSPKAMLPVVEVPMIERIVSRLVEVGVTDVVLSLGYRPDAFRRAYPGGTCAGARLTYAVEPEPRGTAGGIAFAARAAGIAETFLVVNGDILTDLDVRTLVALHQDRQAEATIALAPVDDPSAYGVVPTDERGQVLAFIEKPPRDEAPTNLINAGTYVLEPSVLDLVPEDQPVSIERETFPHLVRSGSLFALGSSDYWLDTGTPATYLKACLDLVSGVRPGPPAPGARDLGGHRWLVDGGEGGEADVVELAADSFLGRSASVAPGARVERSVVGAGCRVEADVRLTGSVLLPGAHLAAGATVEDSVVGPGAVVGEGARLGGLTMVGADEVVAPGSVLDGARVPAA